MILHARFAVQNRSLHDPSRRPGCFAVLLVVLLYLRLITQDRVEQRRMNLYFSVVVDETLFAEFVHEKADPGPGGADHFRKRFLTEGDLNWRRARLLAEIGKQQQQPRKASFAGIEQLVDQVVFD